MRILIVHNSLNDSTSVSGVLKHYTEMATEWVEGGHPTDFLMAKAGWPQVRQLAPKAGLLSSDNFFNASRYLAKTWLYFPAYAHRMLTAHCVRLPQQYDVVYASGQFIVDVYAAMVIARRCRAKLIVKIQHVLQSQTKRQGLINRLFLYAERQSVRWLHRRADLILCLSHVVAGDYAALEQSLGLEPSRTVQVGCGIDVQALLAVPPREKRYDVVLLGRIHEQKGVFDLPCVWEKVHALHPKAQLLIVGEGPHRERLQELLHDRGLSQTVRCTGGISETEKNELLAQGRIGLSLSYEEGWGLSVTEFMAMGMPVVAYQVPVFEEVFPGKLEFVPLGDTAEVARKLTALLEDPVRQERLGREGREFIRRYDYRAVAVEELRALQSVFQ